MAFSRVADAPSGFLSLFELSSVIGCKLRYRLDWKLFIDEKGRDLECFVPSPAFAQCMNSQHQVQNRLYIRNQKHGHKEMSCKKVDPEKVKFFHGEH